MESTLLAVITQLGGHLGRDEAKTSWLLPYLRGAQVMG